LAHFVETVIVETLNDFGVNAYSPDVRAAVATHIHTTAALERSR
jgi:hypothetical protein